MFTSYVKQRYYLYSGNSTLKEPEERQSSSYNTGGATKGQGRRCGVCFMDNDFMTDTTVSATLAGANNQDPSRRCSDTLKNERQRLLARS